MDIRLSLILRRDSNIHVIDGCDVGFSSLFRQQVNLEMLITNLLLTLITGIGSLENRWLNKLE